MSATAYAKRRRDACHKSVPYVLACVRVRAYLANIGQEQVRRAPDPPAGLAQLQDGQTGGAVSWMLVHHVLFTLAWLKIVHVPERTPSNDNGR